MGALLELLFGGGLTTKIAMVVLAGGLVVSGFGYVHKSVELAVADHKVNSLQTQINQLTTDNTQLKENVDLITNVNQTNVATNQKLLDERKDAQAAIATLAKQKKITAEALANAQKAVDDMLKDPQKNDGPLAPVLRETIRGIQK